MKYWKSISENMYENLTKVNLKRKNFVTRKRNSKHVKYFYFFLIL